MSTTSQPSKKIRTLVKELLNFFGLLPVFLKVREFLQVVWRNFALYPVIFLTEICNFYIKILWRLNPGIKSLKDYLPQMLATSKKLVNHSINGKEYSFVLHTPNSVCSYRADSFSTKEPETLEWIDLYGNGGVLFDIGANVGLYSVYHALTQNAPVYAFEPLVFNLPTLVRNINSNNLQSKVKIISNPLSSKCGFAEFKFSKDVEGGAFCGFGVDYGHDGKPLKNANISYLTYGFSLDHLLSTGAITEIPTLIKIDVDGIEHLILEGARSILSDPKCKSVLVEINENFSMQVTKVKDILLSCGFVFKYKKRADEFNQQGIDQGTYNQIWAKS